MGSNIFLEWQDKSRVYLREISNNKRPIYSEIKTE